MQFIVYVSTAAIHDLTIAATLPTYSLSKTSGHLLLQNIAAEVDREKLQIVSFHPGQILSETARSAGLDENSAPFDDGTSQTPTDCGCSVIRPIAFTETIPY
jgi:NAD(P)-dependent dehydrogenase (short-subunit alcohol dehydrogenase family)